MTQRPVSLSPLKNNYLKEKRSLKEAGKYISSNKIEDIRERIASRMTGKDTRLKSKSRSPITSKITPKLKTYQIDRMMPSSSFVERTLRKGNYRDESSFSEIDKYKTTPLKLRSQMR